ncbi:MAG: hypothetical protein RJB55_2513, partial [Verrucomicrobiota bacterium]
LCFPTSWSLEEKIGRGLEEIHGPVPGLNAALGPSIHQVLGRHTPLRHPVRQLPPSLLAGRFQRGVASAIGIEPLPAFRKDAARRITIPQELARRTATQREMEAEILVGKKTLELAHAGRTTSCTRRAGASRRVANSASAPKDTASTRAS